MKKYIKVILLIILIFSCSGCIKYEENMTIKNNKSMNLELVVSTDNDKMKSDMFQKKEINNLNKFYTIVEYNDGKYSGYKLLWSTSNIDKVSSTNNVVYSLTNIRESVPTNIFMVKRGFFSNVYYADFIFDPSEVNSIDYGDSNNDLVFSVDLGKKSLSNNADITKKDGKRLVWNLNDTDVSEINFSFSLYNYSRIVCTIIFSLIIILLLIISVKKILEKRV